LIVTYGTSRSGFSAADVTARIFEFSRRFGVSLPGLLVLAVLGGSLAWRAGGAPFRRLYLLLLAGVVVHGCYWLVLSVGWPRYLYIGVVLLAALVAVPYLALDRPAPAMLYSGMLVLSLLGTVGRLPFPIRAFRGAWFAASPERSSQAIVVRFLDARADHRPFVGQWWGSVSDLEYLSEGVLNFKGYPALTRSERSRGVLVVTNRRFDDAADRRFSTLVARCGPPVLNAAPYAVYECGGRRPTPEGHPLP
jgi:hypothetical protein